MVRELNKLKKRHVNRLKNSIKKNDLINFKKNSDEVGLDYGSGVYSYGQVHADDIIDHYVEWYSYFDDPTLALESFQQARKESVVLCKSPLSESEQKEPEKPDLSKVRSDLSKHRKFRPKLDSTGVKW